MGSGKAGGGKAAAGVSARVVRQAAACCWLLSGTGVAAQTRRNAPNGALVCGDLLCPAPTHSAAACCAVGATRAVRWREEVRGGDRGRAPPRAPSTTLGRPSKSPSVKSGTSEGRFLCVPIGAQVWAGRRAAASWGSRRRHLVPGEAAREPRGAEALIGLM